MKKYILIQNDGEIETNSFELIGASTKRGDTAKIGFFGSGLKYSVAYMMRNKIEFKIFSGELELKFTTVPEKLKDQIFDRICINGKPTSYTVTMGPTWTEDWFVLREIYCNALDESICQMVRETENINAVAGKTRVYIEATENLKVVVDNWDAYFSTEREATLDVEKVYTTFLGDTVTRQIAHIYRKTEGVIYRKGIRVGLDSRMIYDYGFDYVHINEDRTAKNLHALSYVFSDIMAKMPTESYVVSVLRSGNDEKPSYEYSALETTKPDSSFSSQWIEFSKNYMLVLAEKSGKYAEEISRTKKEVLLLPQYFAKELKKQLPQVAILGLGRTIGDVGMTDIATTPKMDYLLKDVIKALNEMKYEVPYDISIVQFDDDETLGSADLKTKQIYLSDKIFDMGRREIAMTIMEEVEHIVSGKGDETRAFQNHLFSSWLKTMENSNGLFF